MRAFALLAAGLAIVTAGCASAGASTNGGAAAIAPASTVAFVVADTKLTASRWHGLGTVLLARLPDEVRTLAAGRELDIAILPGNRTVAFVKGPVEAPHTRAFGEWTAVARDEATLDAVAAAKRHLADVPRYTEAMGALPENALVRMVGDGKQALELFSAIPGQLESRLLPSGACYRFGKLPRTRSAVNVGVLEYRWLASSLASAGDGLRYEALAPRGELVADGPPRLAVQPVAPYTSALVDEIPAGVLGVVDFQVPFGAFELMPKLPTMLTQLFGHDPTLPNELDALLGGETALYLRAGLPTPEITLVTQPADTDQASETLDSMLRAAPKLSQTTLYRAVIGGQFVVSTTRAGIEAFRGGGAKLSSDAGFRAAAKEADMPDRTTGFAYGNVSTLPLLALAGVPIPKDLPLLRSFLAYGAEVQGRSTLTAFLGVG